MTSTLTPPEAPADQDEPVVGKVRKNPGEGLWRALSLPGLLWMTAFFVLGLIIMIAVSFGTSDALGRPRYGFHAENYTNLLNNVYLNTGLRSFFYSLLTVIICLLIGYPVAYVVALHGGRFKSALIAAIVIPFFANYLVRMYAWSTILSDEGLLNGLLRDTGISQGVRWLNTPYAVVAGLVYGFIVFMILPIYAVLERMDTSLIEAGRDLYGSPTKTFWFVTLPSSRAGVISGCLLVFLPAMGDFVSAQFLGGPNTLMIGNLIQGSFLEGRDWPLGSALTVTLMVVLLLLTVGYLRVANRGQRKVAS